MRDGIRLATDLYLPPTLPAPVIVVRTPYGRDWAVSMGPSREIGFLFRAPGSVALTLGAHRLFSLPSQGE